MRILNSIGYTLFIGLIMGYIASCNSVNIDALKVSKESLVGQELDFTLLINGRQVATQTHSIANVQRAYLPYVASER